MFQAYQNGLDRSYSSFGHSRCSVPSMSCPPRNVLQNGRSVVLTQEGKPSPIEFRNDDFKDSLFAQHICRQELTSSNSKFTSFCGISLVSRYEMGSEADPHVAICGRSVFYVFKMQEIVHIFEDPPPKPIPILPYSKTEAISFEDAHWISTQIMKTDDLDSWAFMEQFIKTVTPKQLLEKVHRIKTFEFFKKRYLAATLKERSEYQQLLGSVEPWTWPALVTSKDYKTAITIDSKTGLGFYLKSSQGFVPIKFLIHPSKLFLKIVCSYGFTNV